MLSRLESLELMQSILPQHSGVDAWMAWVKRNFHLSATTAKSYMKLAETTHKDSRLSFSTLSEVVSPHRKHHQPTWHQPVRETMNRVNVESLADKWLAVSVTAPTSGSLNRPPICRTRPWGVLPRQGQRIIPVASGCGFAEILPSFSLFCIVKCLIFLTGLGVR